MHGADLSVGLARTLRMLGDAARVCHTMGVRSVRHQDTASRSWLLRRLLLFWRCRWGWPRRTPRPTTRRRSTRSPPTSFSAKVGGSVTFTAQTFDAGSAVAVDVSEGGTSVGSSTTTANGKGIATSKVTFTVAGVNRVTMSGTSDTGDALSLSADVTVTAEGDNVVPVSDGGNDDNGSGRQWLRFR